jgi:sialate O-acetylesterase
MSHKLWLPAHFSSGMILQQQVPSLLRGQTRPGSTIRLELERMPFSGRPVSAADNQYGIVADLSTTSDKAGKFELEIPAFAASLDPFTLRISDGKESRTIEDLLFGEVWVTGGGANMQMPMAAVAEPNQMPLLANLHYIRVLQQSETGLGPKHISYSY